MKDIADRMPAAQTVREYLHEMVRTGEVIRWLWKETTTKKIRHYGHQVLATTFISSLASMLMPVALRYFFDAFEFRDLSLIRTGVIASIALLFVTNAAGYWHGRSIEWFAGLHHGKIDDRITELFFEKSIGQHSQESSYLSASNIEKARGRILTVIGIITFEAIPILCSIIVAYAALFFVNIVAGVVMTFVIAFYLSVMAYLNKKVFEVCTPIDKELRRINRYRFSRWDNVPWVQINTKESHELAQPAAWFDSVITKDRDFWIWYCKRAVLRHAVAKISFIGIMVYAVWKAVQGGGTMSSLYMVASWCTFIVEHLWQIGQAERNINYHIPSIRAMIETLSIPPSITVKNSAVCVPKMEPIHICFENVSYEYDRSRIESKQEEDELKNHVLKNVSFEIRSGEKVALIGQSGAGKSTIMNLLLRGEDPKRGRILVNGIDLRDLDLAWWRSVIGYIPQTPVVFDGTVRENLLYGLPRIVAEKISDAELWAFAEKMRVNFEGRLTHGLNTVVGRSGIKLSGGERQRIVIAEAVMKNPRFMIIDEPTSSLDSLTEHEVQEGLEAALSKGVGALIIAHRLSTVRKCDRFIVLRKSALVQNGDSQIEAVASSFEDLYRVSDTFKRMADKQNITL